MRLMAVAALVFVPMLIEALRAARNEREQLARGGVRAAGDVHDTMRLVYPGVFLWMMGEGLFRPFTLHAFVAGLCVFLAAKLLKWWAIVTLGQSWTFRVIVVPGAPLVTRGPYRFIRHPNYVAVVGELIGTALMTSAVLMGPLALVVFGTLLYQRIHIEDRALEAVKRRQPDAILRPK